jgi:hypothetical protein
MAFMAVSEPVFAQNEINSLRFPDQRYLAPRPAPRYIRPAPLPRRAYKQSTIIVEDQAAKPKVDPSAFIVVMGDSLAGLLADGLDRVYADNPAIAVTHKARSDSGLARPDFYDWPRAVQDMLASDEKITVGVVMIGVNDHQPIRDGEAMIEPDTERWKELYLARVDAITKAFADKHVPLVWVGLPPMKSDKFSADMLAFNGLFRARVTQAGGVFVDLWDTFVSDDNRYSAYGPSVDGQIVKLRTNDGVHFTRAGAFKAAHFADVEIRRLLERERGTTIVALPSEPAGLDPALNPSDVERMIDQSIPALPEPPGAISVPVKPLAGPILPLTNDAAPANGGTLITTRPAFSQASTAASRTLREGLPPSPQQGRADDFRWPRP